MKDGGREVSARDASAVPANAAPLPSVSRWREAWRWLAKGAGTWLVLAALAGMGALAFMPEPEIKRLGFVPRDVAVFFDRNDFLKNLLGFGALRVALAVGLAPFAFTRGWRGGAWVTLSALGFVVLLEAGQMFLPKRNFDWNDILAGGLGVIVVGVCTALAGAAARYGRERRARGGAA